jgi:hypothetical protein
VRYGPKEVDDWFFGSEAQSVLGTPGGDFRLRAGTVQQASQKPSRGWLKLEPGSWHGAWTEYVAGSLKLYQILREELQGLVRKGRSLPGSRF